MDNFTKDDTVSGERLTVGKSSKRNQEDHVARYAFACDYVKDKTVLDIACGTGYGVKMLSDAGAREVVGVDIDLESIELAQKNFSGENISYQCESASDIKFEDEKFDVIVTFETIEHLDDDIRAQYLSNLRLALKKDGIIILSTPNKLITSPWSKKPLNPYHVLEYYRETLEVELGYQGLIVMGWYGQRFVKKFFTHRTSYLLVRIFEKMFRKSFGIYDIANGATVAQIPAGSEPRYFVVIIKKHD